MDRSLTSTEKGKMLLEATEEGNLEAVKRLLEQGVFVDYSESSIENGSTSLQIASGRGYEDIVRLLLKKGAALDMQNVYGFTALMQGARSGHHSIVKLLLQNKADYRIKSKLGVSVLSLAAKSGSLNVLRSLLEIGDLDPKERAQFVTPVMAAAQCGHDSVLSFLMNHGATADDSNEFMGISPLMLAALSGHTTTAQLLVDWGSDPDQTNISGKTALEYAIKGGKRTREVRHFLESKTKNKPYIKEVENDSQDILEAIISGNKKLVRRILEDFPEKCKVVGVKGVTPLMQAAMQGRLDLVEMLVDYGAEVNVQDHVNSWTALMQSTYHGWTEVAKFLLLNGADPSIVGSDNNTAFEIATLMNNQDTELIRLLAPKTQKPNIKALKGHSLDAKNKDDSLKMDNTDLDLPKTGLKAWWTKMSSRFRNLKIARTLRGVNASTTQLKPLSLVNSNIDDDPNTVNEVLLTGKKIHLQKAVGSLNSSIDSGLDTSGRSINTLTLPAPKSKVQTEKLIPVVPPFLPPPTYEVPFTDRSRHYSFSSSISIASMPTTQKNSSTSVIRSQQKSSGRSSLESSWNNSVTILEHSGSATKLDQNVRPSFPPTRNYRSLSDNWTNFSRHSAGTKHLPNNSIFYPKRISEDVKSNRSAASTLNSSGSSTVTPASPMKVHDGNQFWAEPSIGNTSPTLTPPNSPRHDELKNDPKGHINVYHGHHRHSKDTSSSSGVSEEDELSNVLKKLALEQYKPVFEEQEVDMEAFLKLSDNDLQELGIIPNESRKKILKAITELSTSKDQERQFLQQTFKDIYT